MPAMKVYDFVFGQQLENIEIVNSEQTLIFCIYCDIGYPWLKHKLFGNNRFIFIMYSKCKARFSPMHLMRFRTNLSKVAHDRGKFAR